MTNPITSYSAVEFLVFYGAVIALVVGLCAVYLRSNDPTRSMTLPSMPNQVDPYEVAYLQGGQDEVLRVVIVSLAERGFLKLETLSPTPGGTPLGLIVQAKNPKSGDLAPIEQLVYDWISNGRTANDVFAWEVPDLVRGYCLPFEERLQQAQLLRADDDGLRRGCIRTVGALMVGGIGGWRLIVGLSRGRPVGFLLAMLGVGILLVIVTCTPKRLSSLGKAYLRQLRNGIAKGSAGGGTQYALAVAVLGPSALIGTPLENLGKEVRKSNGGQGGDGCSGGDGCGGCGGCG